MKILRPLVLLLLLLPLALRAQDPPADREEELTDRIFEYIDEFGTFTEELHMKTGFSDANLESDSYINILRQKIHMLGQQLQAIEFRWNAFTQSEQTTLAASEELMELMGRVQTLDQTAHDSLDAQQQRCDAIANFLAAEQLILSQDSIYKALYKKAEELSWIEKEAPQLEKLKAKEQTLFGKIEEHYTKSADIAKLEPRLAQRAETVDERYHALKTLSAKIQSMEYKPFIVRAKDYLLGLACVAVLLIFVNSAVTKLQAAKKARDMVKKQKEFFKKNNDEKDYPTI